MNFFIRLLIYHGNIRLHIFMVTNSIIQIKIAHHVTAGNNDELFFSAVEIVTMAVELIQVTARDPCRFI
ncbi:hypothetical protein D3C85_1786280 [compost metagenome]